MGKRRRVSRKQLGKFAIWLGKFVLKSQLLTLFLGLFALGLWAGTRSHASASSLPYDELFENMSVLSYRESPSDSNAHFVVELSAASHVFREYDLDARCFVDPVRGRDYRRSISGTHYPALTVRGHVPRGFWLQLSSASARTLLPDQFNELYQSTLSYVKPLSIATSVVGTLSGYSIGYRMATWSRSLSNPAVQDRMLSRPGIGRLIGHEAWRRVLLEPLVMGDEGEAARFAAVHGTQRLYGNFFKLALNDSDNFIAGESARLDTLGHQRESHVILAFARSVRHAAQDTCNLTSADLGAIENWAILLDRSGHWSQGTLPTASAERMRYLGTLAWYGIAPTQSQEQRIWVGPRVLVREGGAEGFVDDDILQSPTACPTTWRKWVRSEGDSTSAPLWTAQWMTASREIQPVVELARGVAQRLMPGR